MRTLGIPGEEHPDVVNALEFIERYKTGGNLRVGRNVVVIGAGNTAIDAARAAVAWARKKSISSIAAEKKTCRRSNSNTNTPNVKA